MLKARRRKKCRVCREWFRPFRTTQVVCNNLKCAIEYGQLQAAKRRRRDQRAAKERIKTRSQLLKEAQGAFNRFCRVRDGDLGCVSCDKPASWGGQWHASHYRSVGAHPEFRFDEMNVHKACSICNNFASGALLEYRENLIVRIGEAGVLRLEGPAELPKWTIEQIIEIKKNYRKKTRELEKVRGLKL